MNNKNLPKIKDLYNEKVILAQKNDLNVLLNQEPNKNWIKTHPMFKNVKYLSIERIEWLLTSIFIDWSIEIKEIKLIANSVITTVRLHYKDPITGEIKYQDGIGASPLQTVKDAAATDWTKIKNDAVMKAAPASKSFAVKDAAEQLGKLFGKDLNRADKILYDSLADKFSNPETIESKLANIIALIDKLPKEKQTTYKDILKEKKKSNELTLATLDNMQKQIQDDIL